MRREAQRGIRLYWQALLVLRLATPSTLAQEATKPETDGKLILYPHMSERGVVACRKYHDENGRLGRVTYYTTAPTTRPSKSAPVVLDHRPLYGPFDPNDLVILWTEASDYDDAGRVVRTSRYDRAGALSGFATHRYEEEGFVGTTIHFTADGRKSCEIRYAPPKEKVVGGAEHPGCNHGPEQVHLLFDDTGERLIAVRGPLPDDRPWTWGWGPVREGLRCAIAPSRERGPLACVRVAISVRNVTNGGRNVAGGQGCFRPVLVDADDRMVPIGPRGQQHLRESHIVWRSIEPDHVAHSECFTLGWWYPDLPPGRYSLHVEYRGDRGDPTEWLLVSNTVTITIQSSSD